jgi:hypothetical protein
VYFIGQYALSQADGSSFPNAYLCIAALAYFAAFMAQPMTDFGIYFCTIFSSVIWGFLATKIVDYFCRRSRSNRLVPIDEME